MVKVGDWVKVHKDADRGKGVPPFPVLVTNVRNGGNIDVNVDTAEYCDYWFEDQYDIVPSPGDPDPSVKREILERAIALITGDREEDYGEAHKNFADIAALWSVVLGVDVQPWQVAACMSQLKLARAIKTSTHADSWVDMAGYVGLAAELALGSDNG